MRNAHVNGGDLWAAHTAYAPVMLATDAWTTLGVPALVGFVGLAGIVVGKRLDRSGEERRWRREKCFMAYTRMIAAAFSALYDPSSLVARPTPEGHDEGHAMMRSVVGFNVEEVLARRLEVQTAVAEVRLYGSDEVSGLAQEVSDNVLAYPAAESLAIATTLVRLVDACRAELPALKLGSERWWTR